MGEKLKGQKATWTKTRQLEARWIEARQAKK